MPSYRLEIWFDFKNDKVDWGMAQTLPNSSDSTPFASGGNKVSKNDGKVVMPGSANQAFDIYLFDESGDDAGRRLQWFAIDYEEAANPSPGQTTNNPIGNAATLRSGVTGDTFMGTIAGGAVGTTGAVGQENHIVSDNGNLANRRWSLAQGYSQALTAGNYSFTVAFVIGSPSEGMVKGFTVDPEMDIQT